MREEEYYLPVPPALSDALLNTFHFDLMADPRYKERYDKARSEWLEQSAIEVLKRHFRTDQAYWSLKYEPKKARVELDGLVLYDNKLILIECKWKSLTITARQGNVEAAHVDIAKSIGASYSQAARARDYIRCASAPIIFTTADGKEVTINPGEIKEIFLVSLLGRGAMSVLATNLPALAPKEIFSEGDHPWALSFIDLSVVCDLMEFPSQLLDYIKRRDAVMRDGRLISHDEWDLLGLYLDGELDSHNPRFKGYTRISIIGADRDVDQYLRSRAGKALPKIAAPRRRLPENVRQVIGSVESTGEKGRSDFVVALLGMPDSVLKEVERRLDTLSSKSRANEGIHHASLTVPHQNCGITILTTNGQREEANSALVELCGRPPLISTKRN